MNLDKLPLELKKDEPLNLKKKVINLNKGSEDHYNPENFYDEDYFYRIYGYYPDEKINSRHSL